MILIEKNSDNPNVVATLNELIQGTFSFDFLFSFTNDTTLETKLFSAPDISTATERYNRFNIIETTNEDLYYGSVELEPEGYWSYIIYQMDQQSPPNLNPDDAVKILEIGKVLVKGITQSVAVFTTDENITNVVFDE